MVSSPHGEQSIRDQHKKKTTNEDEKEELQEVLKYVPVTRKCI